MRVAWGGFILAVFAACSVGAQVPSKGGSAQDFWGRWKSPRLAVIPDNDPLAQWTEGRHPGWLFSMVKASGFSPETQPFTATEAGCAADDLEESLRSEPKARNQGLLIDKMFKRCAADWESGVRDRTRNSFQIMRLRFDWPSHPLIRRVVLRLPGGGVLKGLLALKGDDAKRPFVVVRLGIFSSVEEFLPERFLLMQLFEQGISNVLVIENVTGSDYIANNEGFSIGGLNEGFQNLQIARMLRDPNEPLAKLVGSLHFVGMSLGGHGLFHAAAISARQSRMDPLIDSFIAFCPVAHLRPTVERVIRPGIDGVLTDIWVRLRLAGLRKKWPDLPSGWSSWFKGEPAFFPAVLKNVEEKYRLNTGLTEGLHVPEHWRKDFWTASDPWLDWPSEHAEFLVIATRDDEFVPLSVNTERLRTEMQPRDPHLGVAILDQGFHCTLPVSYKWNVISAMLNGAIASHARVSEKMTSMDVDLEPALEASALAKPYKIGYDIDWPSEGPFVILKFKVEHDGGQSRFSLNMPISQFDFRAVAGGENPALRESLKRWLHRRLRVGLVSHEGRASLRVQWPRLSER